MAGFDDVAGFVVVDGWRAEGCQHEHGSVAGTCSDGDIVDVDETITTASH
jgi:hypothetical protein